MEIGFTLSSEEQQSAGSRVYLTRAKDDLPERSCPWNSP